MNRKLLTLCVCGFLALAQARAQLAITETMSSASTNLDAGLVVQGPDFWELSNFGAAAIDLTGYKFNDSDAIRGGDAVTLPDNLIIGPGESIIFVQSGATIATKEDFTNWWGAANLPVNLQVEFYSGNGQSSSGDSIVLWSPTATSDADYVDRADFGEAIRGHTFTYNPTNGVFGIVSSNGIGHAFKAVTSDDEGSPGTNSGPVALAIIQQPTPNNFTVPASSDATFTIAARGLPRPHYQWRFNVTNLIDGAIQPALTIANAQLTNAGQYTCLVANGLTTLTSSVAVLTVTTFPVAPTFVTGPKSQDAFVGQTVQFSALASGSPTPSLQWRSNGVDLVGETSGTLTLFNVQSNQTATYTIVASNGSGTNSVSADLTVTARPRLLITEVQPSGSGESGHADWWELTSFDTRTFNLTGWRWDDNSHSVAPGNAYIFTNDIFIHPGESVVFVENITASQFRTWWGTNLPAGLQIITYIGGGLGLSQTTDEVNLWNAVTLAGNEPGERVCVVNFAATSLGSTLVYDPENPPVAAIFNVVSTNTVSGNVANGIFAADQLGSFGSPGYVVGPITVSASRTGGNIVLNWSAVNNRNYTVEYETNLTDTTWTTLTNLTATGANASASDSLGANQRFYRVGTIIPYVPEQP